MQESGTSGVFTLIITHIFFGLPVERVYIAELMCYLYNTNRPAAYVLEIAPKDMGNDKVFTGEKESQRETQKACR